MSLLRTIRPLEQAIAGCVRPVKGGPGHPSRSRRLLSVTSFARVPAHDRIDDVTRWASWNAVSDPRALLFEKAPPVVHQLLEQGPGRSAVGVENGLPLRGACSSC